MRVFTFSQWQYEGDVFACQICDEENQKRYIDPTDSYSHAAVACVLVRKA